MLDRILARVAAASSGPWWSDGCSIYHWPDFEPEPMALFDVHFYGDEPTERFETDFRFIENARQDVEYLLSIIDGHKEQLAAAFRAGETRKTDFEEWHQSECEKNKRG